jgi:PAS domain S-box-containing protein
MLQYVPLVAATTALICTLLTLTTKVKSQPKLQTWLILGTAILLVSILATYSTASFQLRSDKTWIKTIDAIDVPMLIYDDRTTIVYANDAAQKYYGVDLQSLLGKDPQQLHVWAKPYMVNFKEWSEEQMSRNTQARLGTLNSKSIVPMHMSKDHFFGEKDWYLSSHNLYVNGRRFLLTRFSPCSGLP